MHAAAATTLTPRLEIELATEADDAGVRALLRNAPMGEAIAITLEREPRALHIPALDGPRHTTVVCRHPDGAVLAVGARSVRPVWWNQEPAWLGTLSQLRRRHDLAGAFRLLREGFDRLESERQEDELPFDISSIVSDNHSARRLFERGLPALPMYEQCTPLITLRLSSLRGARPSLVAQGTSADLPALVDCINRNAQRFQAAPRMHAADLTMHASEGGLCPERFLVVREGARITGCCAIWDQRAFRQARVHRYAAWWRHLLPVERLLSRCLHRPPLPRPGDVMPLAFLSYLFVDSDDLSFAAALVDAARRSLPAGVRWLVATVEPNHPFARLLQRQRCGPELATTLYRVARPGSLANQTLAPDGRPFHVEGAYL